MHRRKLVLLVLGIIIIGAIFIIVFYFHSGQEYPDKTTKKKGANYSKRLQNVNRFLVEKDKERIKSFIERRGWQMQTTKSGLWYQIVSDEEGKRIQHGDKVKINYEVRLLDGTLCYTSDSTGAKEFIVGRKETMMGLQEGIKLLNEGDRARLIIPPHLGYGLIGDEKRIPARAVLVYTLDVLEVEENKTSKIKRKNSR
jgi:FKBP-type peptidyl-prolyl cis-trans isomerase